MIDVQRNNEVAVIIPCYNEQGAIANVVKDFQEALPQAKVYVFDNNSSDETILEAEKAGAVVYSEKLQGKGHVVRRMFSEIDADCYLMADGDGTYDASFAPKLVEKLLCENLDMVVGCRVPEADQETYRPGHAFGNKLLTTMAGVFFGRGFTDMLSGYRAFSRRFAKSFPILAGGFEIETEMTIHCLSMMMPTGEVSTPYYERAEGTESKLNTYRDGFKILFMMIRLFKDYRPMAFFGISALLLFLSAIILFLPLLFQFMDTGLVERVPTAILCTGLTLSSLLSVACGFILDSVARHRLETKRLAYLMVGQSNQRWTEDNSIRLETRV